MAATPFIQHLTPVKHAEAQGAQKNILDIALKQVGFIPNMYANMANAPGLLSTYLHGYALFRGEAGLTPAEQEVVFLAISQVNDCHYCSAAHAMIADKMSGVPREVLRAIRSNTSIPVAKLSALYNLAADLTVRRGKPTPSTLKAFFDAGYQERDVLYVILAISVKVLSNYSNHAFGTQVDDMFSAYKVGAQL